MHTYWINFLKNILNGSVYIYLNDFKMRIFYIYPFIF